MDCLFCKIIEGKIPSAKVYEDENVLAFKDIQPQAPLHYLFVPKHHTESLATLPESETGIIDKIFTAIKKVAEKEGVSKRGYRTVINTNGDGGQTVWHLHVHLMAGKKMGGGMTGV
jgi:histidine triad (HIT) family protein